METALKVKGETVKGEAQKEKQPPRVNNATRVTVAFPFSSIELYEPLETTIELASLVAELAHQVARGAPGGEVEKLAVEADELVAKMKERS